MRLKLWGIVEGVEITGAESPIELVVEYGTHLDLLTVVDGQRTTICYPRIEPKTGERHGR